ncbi:hypothetical protein ACFXPV_13950 [Streptomyces sp. NPDC059118]|uniref:hypothetical protein n=1 Tax=unclassified Streptomyces TaxID=2593676 RepID=UPI0036799D7A
MSAETDPDTVVLGQSVDENWMVRRVLGTEATVLVLLVERVAEEAGGPGGRAVVEERIFKVALYQDKDARLYAEAQALKTVDGGRVFRLLEEPRDFSLADASERDIAASTRGYLHAPRQHSPLAVRRSR